MEAVGVGQRLSGAAGWEVRDLHRVCVDNRWNGSLQSLGGGYRVTVWAAGGRGVIGIADDASAGMAVRSAVSMASARASGERLALAFA
jgi:hypothetical protein